MSVDSAKFCNFLPSSISEPINQAYSATTKFLTDLNDGYNRCADLCIAYLPEKLRPFAKRISNAIPETLFCAAMITGTVKCLALTYWFARSLWLLSPILKSLARGEVTTSQLNKASHDSVDLAQDLYMKFKPAIAVSCAIGALFSAIMGFISCTPRLLMHASFLGGVSYLAVRSILDEKDESVRQSAPASCSSRSLNLPPPVIPPPLLPSNVLASSLPVGHAVLPPAATTTALTASHVDPTPGIAPSVQAVADPTPVVDTRRETQVQAAAPAATTSSSEVPGEPPKET